MIRRNSNNNNRLKVKALPLDECFAKTWVNANGDRLLGRKVLNHCQIVGEVARELLTRMPYWLVEVLFPKGSELIAAAHDLGKVSPTFQKKIISSIFSQPDFPYSELAGVDPSLENSWGGHAGLSQIAAEALKVGKYIPEILGQHHGYSPNPGLRLAHDESFGGSVWQERRAELLEDLRMVLQTDFPVVDTPLKARVLAGLTTVADWLGSGSLFENPADDWRPRIQQSINNAGFVKPCLIRDLTFSDIFNGMQPREIQRSFIDSVAKPGMYILEAPMGLGKTEAALYAAYRLLSQDQANGLYFALPTQLTSDKIHDRVECFLQRILDPASPHHKVLLLHGNAWLKEMELGKEGNPGGDWFQFGKRGILAPFAVGTVDQALMAVMNVKHGFVRAFGLAGKVVILDEVHTYDSYTGTILDEMVKALLDLHCTVIVLSATLTTQRRIALTGRLTLVEDYPLITALPRDGELRELATAEIADVHLKLRCVEESVALEEVLLRAELGQHVLWIENTVAEAQALFKIVTSRAVSLGIECGLLHSRFTKLDRHRNDDYWVGRFGREGWMQRGQQGRILVGTQVLEQSLDIDADFLISRFAPSDMLLQRMGRLWRHDGTPRPIGAAREVWLLTPAWQEALDQPERAFGKSAKVYSPYVLCRSLEVWRDLEQVALPSQIRSLVEQTYVAREEQGIWLTLAHRLEKQRQDLRSMALLGVSSSVPTMPEAKASTRYGEQESVEVLLIKSFQMDKSRRGLVFLLLDDSILFLPEQARGLSNVERRELAAKLLMNTVRVPAYLAPIAMPAEQLQTLQCYIYVGKAKNGESFLRIAKLKGCGELATLDGGAPLSGYALAYDHLGYRADKI